MSSQIDLATIPQDQLAEMLSFKLKCSKQTEALRARLPAQLAPFASNISIIEPIQTVRTSPDVGIHWSACRVEERIICMSVASPHSQSQDSEEPHAKPLTLVWQDWWTSSKYLTGTANSRMLSVSLRYGPPGRGTCLQAATGVYSDPGCSESYSNHGGIKSVVKEVVRDLGFEGELDKKAHKVIAALLGDDGRELLKKSIDDGPTLKTIIRKELEVEDRGY